MKISVLHLKKIIFLFACVFFLSLTTYAQNGSIVGTVKTSDGAPAEYVIVTIEGVKNTVVDKSGQFTFRNIKPGYYKVTASYIGLGSQSEGVRVIANQKSTLNFLLSESGQKLEEVIVKDNGANKFAKKETPYVSRLPLKNLENPQVYSVITDDLLKEQVVTNFDDAIKNAPGIDKLWSSTGRGGDGAAYFSMRGFVVQPSMINGIAGLSNGGLDPANLERLEILKGPSGTLFGSSLVSFGGLINLVTKKPFEKEAGEISYNTGSYGLSRVTADYNTPLNNNERVLFRVNGAYHTENSFQDAGFKKSVFIAPSLVYKASEKLTFHVNTELYNSEATNPLMVFLNRSRPLIATTPDDLGIDFRRSFTSNDITIKNPTFNLYGQMEYKISDQWTSQTNISRSVRKSDGLYSYVMFLGTTDTLFSRYVGDQLSIGTTTDIQQNFVGDFKVGSLRNRLVVGLDVFNSKAVNSTTYTLFDQLSSVNSKDPKYNLLTRNAVEAKIASGTPGKSSANIYTYSAYASDVLNITDRFLAMMSLRVDRFDNKASDFQQTAFSPKLGLVYQILPEKVSLFGNYMNGFQNVAPSAQPDGTIRNFEPQQANQWEGGLKFNIIKNKVSGTISYYDINVNNVIRPDPDNVGFSVQDGNIYSKGFEADIIANPFTGLNIIAGYSHNESINEKSNPSIQGRRPVSSGPENLVNAWVSYTASMGVLKGAGVGFGGNYASENLITNNSINGVFTLPSYTVFNASIFYGNDKYRLALKADNLTDKDYYKGWTTVEYQRPRSFTANISFMF